MRGGSLILIFGVSVVPEMHAHSTLFYTLRDQPRFLIRRFQYAPCTACVKFLLVVEPNVPHLF